jgi:hypothetical protein
MSSNPSAQETSSSKKGDLKRDILRVSGGEKVIEWDRYFGMGIYGAILSILAGLLILIFPWLMTFIVGVFLILMGIWELLRHTKRKVVSVVKSI